MCRFDAAAERPAANHRLNRRGRVLAEAGISRRALLVADLSDDDLRAGGPRRWRNTSPAIAAALYEQYQLMFARHENLPLGKQSL